MLGGLWYSQKMFGEKWAEGVGINTEEGGGQPVPALVLQFIGTLLMAWVIGITAANEALLTAGLIVVTITVLLTAGSLFHQNNRFAVTTESGFVVVMAVIMILCQALF